MRQSFQVRRLWLSALLLTLLYELKQVFSFSTDANVNQSWSFSRMKAEYVLLVRDIARCRMWWSVISRRNPKRLKQNLLQRHFVYHDSSMQAMGLHPGIRCEQPSYVQHPVLGRRNFSVGIMPRLRAGCPTNRCLTPGRIKISLSKASRPAPGPTQPPVQRVQDAVSTGVRRPRCEADHSLPSSVEFNNARTYTSIPLYGFMAWNHATLPI
jgi:hypothetical protein